MGMPSVRGSGSACVRGIIRVRGRVGNVAGSGDGPRCAFAARPGSTEGVACCTARRPGWACCPILLSRWPPCTYYTVPAWRLIVVALVLAGTALWRDRCCKSSARQDPTFPMVTGTKLGISQWKTITCFSWSSSDGALAPGVGIRCAWYHLQFPRMWLDHARCLRFPHGVSTRYYPHDMGVLYGTGLALGGPIIAKLLHFLHPAFVALMVISDDAPVFFRTRPPWPASHSSSAHRRFSGKRLRPIVDLALTLHAGLHSTAPSSIRGLGKPAVVASACAGCQVGLASGHQAPGIFSFSCRRHLAGIFLRRRRGLRASRHPCVTFRRGESAHRFFPWYVAQVDGHRKSVS